MFVGHAFLALALGLLLGRLAGFDERGVLAFALLLAGSSVLPDLDLVVSVGTIVSVLGDSPVAAWEGYWGASNAIHRGVSHTLVGGTGIGLVLAGAAVGVRGARGRQIRQLSVGIVVGLLGLGLPLVVVGPAVDAVGWLGYSAVLLGALLLGGFAAHRSDLGDSAIAAGGLLGAWLHPFTDIFIGSPPAMFYPFESPILGESVTFAADPTLNLLGVTAAELAAIWVGVVAASRVRGRSLRELVAPVALAGVGFPVVMALLPRPTMVDAHWLGFPLVPFALVGLVPVLEGGRSDPDWPLRAIVTGLATLSIATATYALSYRLFPT